MKNKHRKNFTITGLLFLSFLLFTCIVKTVDVKAIGPKGSSVGLAALNQFVFQRLGVHLGWYAVTDWLGVAALLTACGFALVGLTQLLRRKSLLKVDGGILLLGAFYVAAAAVYVLFECVVVNYRPIILHTELEASYPSSHTMLVICVMSTAIMQFRRLLPEKKGLRIFLDGAAVLLIVVTVVGRLLSGVHWFTDILAGVLLSSALVMLYFSALTWLEEKVRR